jgi:hypothetical protein
MTKNKFFRAALILSLAAGLFMIPRIISGALRLAETRRSLKQYREALQETKPLPPAYIEELRLYLEKLKAEERDRPGKETEIPFSISDAAGMIRDLLKNENIEPERFRISGREPDETIEFILHCESIPFFTFLREASDIRGIVISYLGIKPVPGLSLIDVTMRIQNER